jgi:hypothetical protein
MTSVNMIDQIFFERIGIKRQHWPMIIRLCTLHQDKTKKSALAYNAEMSALLALNKMSSMCFCDSEVISDLNLESVLSDSKEFVFQCH